MAVLGYLPIFDSGFIWDDDKYIETNAALRGSLADIWLKPKSLPQYYPLVHTTFLLEFRAWGLDPLGYHVVNLALHLVAVILFYRVLAALAIPGAIFAAGLFAVHPVMVESVAWVTERKNVLSMVFYLLSGLACLRLFGLDQRPALAGGPRRAGVFAGALLLFLAALCSKSVTFSLPFAMWLLCYWKRGRVSLGEVLWMLPLVGIGSLYGVVTSSLEASHVGAAGAEWSETMVQRVLIAGRVPWFYLGSLLWPFGLSFNYPRWEVDPAIAWQWVFPGATVAVLLVALWFACWRSRRGPLVALLFFGGTLFPALGFISVYPFRYSFVADHFQYHACLSVLAGVAAAAAALRIPRGAQWPVAAAVLVGLAGLTWSHASTFVSRDALFTATLRNNPESWWAMNNLASLRIRQGEEEEGRQLYIQAKSCYPALGGTPEIGPEAYAEACIASDKGKAIQREIELLKRLTRDGKALTEDREKTKQTIAELRPLVVMVMEECLDHLNRALKIEPSYVLALETAANCHLVQYDLQPGAPTARDHGEAASRYLDRAVRSSPRRRDLRQRAIRLHQEMLHFYKANTPGAIRHSQAIQTLARQSGSTTPNR